MTQGEEATGMERAVVRTIMLRLMPLLGLLYMVAYIDRQNIAYAKLQMVGDLGLSEAAYGLGAGLFFIGYCLFEIPSNIILERMGARIWFARILGTWGLVTVALGFAWTPTSFYILRFLLGVAEAGFFPGVLYALTLWFPQAYRARAVGTFMVASAFANAVGSAIGGALLTLDGLAGLRGWQWVFIATGIPALLLVPVVLVLLPRGPAEARWLNEAQKQWLATVLASERTERGIEQPLKALGDRRVILLAVTFLGFPLGAYGLSYWLPTIVKGFGVSDMTNGLLNIIPWLCVAAALWWYPRYTSRRPDRPWYVAAPLVTGAVCLVIATLVPGVPFKFVALCIAAAAIFAGQPGFWALPTRILSGAGAAAGLAAINSVGNLGGFVAQTVVPRIKDETGSDLAPMLFLAVCLVLTAIGVLLIASRLGHGTIAGDNQGGSRT